MIFEEKVAEFQEGSKKNEDTQYYYLLPRLGKKPKQRPTRIQKE